MRALFVLSGVFFILSCGTKTQKLQEPEESEGAYSHFLRVEGYCPHPDKLDFSVLTPELSLKEVGVLIIKEYVNWQTVGGSKAGDLCPLVGPLFQTADYKTFQATLVTLAIEKGYFPNTLRGKRRAKVKIRQVIEAYTVYQRKNAPDPSDALNCGQYRRKQCDVILSNCTRNCESQRWDFSIPNGDPNARYRSCIGSCYSSASNCYWNSMVHLLGDQLFNEYLNCHEKSAEACSQVGYYCRQYCETLSQFSSGYSGLFSSSPRARCYENCTQKEKNCVFKFVPIF